MKKRCEGYCGLACVNGECPNAMDDLDRRSDTDKYAAYHLDRPVRCSECGYNRGREDCIFDGTDQCSKDIKNTKEIKQNV